MTTAEPAFPTSGCRVSGYELARAPRAALGYETAPMVAATGFAALVFAFLVFVAATIRDRRAQ